MATRTAKDGAGADTPVPEATHDPFAPDEFTGIGGDYIRDPITGKRTPAPSPSPQDD